MIIPREILSLSEQTILEQGLSLKNIYQPMLYTHSRNVAVLSILLGDIYRLNLQELLDLGTGGLLHDYGKISIADSILEKPSALSDQEFYLMRGHPSQGYRELKRYGFDKNVLEIILMHHEKLDGSGYPSGVSELSTVVQIVTIADMFDAIHARRSYHDAQSVEKTIDILKNSPGLNQTMVKLLADVILADTDELEEADDIQKSSGKPVKLSDRVSKNAGQVK